MRSIRLPLLTLAFFATFPPLVPAQIGPEFQINTQTTGIQDAPTVAVDGAGNFVVVWSGEGSNSLDREIYGQRYDSEGNPAGAEFQVNTYTTYFQLRPAVAADPAGNFVVVWDSRYQDGGGGPGASSGVFGQRYDSAGNPVGGEFQVNTYTTSSQVLPAIATDGAGNSVVVWQSLGQDGSSRGIFGQRYDSGGNALGGEFLVNTSTANNQHTPDVASDVAGNFVVVWNGAVAGVGNYAGIFGQRYDSGGNAVGAEFQVNTVTAPFVDRGSPAVAADATGTFMVVWFTGDQDGESGSGPQGGVFGRRYNSGGGAVGAEFQVNTYTPNRQREPAVAADGTGDFVVVWSSDRQEGYFADGGIYAQRYDSSGNAVGAEFQVNAFTTGDQRGPVISADGAGNFVVVWPSRYQDGSDFGIFGQRYDASGRQTVLGKLVKLVNPIAGVRRVEVRGTESRTNNTVLGDPLTYGATMEVIAHGNVDQDQTFALPPGVGGPGVPGWTSSGSGTHWRYRDGAGVNGPVRRVTVKRVRRTFVVSAVIKGTASSPSPGVGLIPPGNGTDAGFVLTIHGPRGATYCVSLGGPNGGTIGNTATAFLARSATAETGCPSP
jgi:hypothetical protein